MRNDRGAAMVEGILLTLVLVVPVIWLLGVLADVHRGALAATAAAREGGFAAARTRDPVAADKAIEAAVTTAFLNHGADGRAARVRWAGRLEGGGRVEVLVAYPVPVLQAPFLGRVGGPSVWVRARHAAAVDRYGSDG